MEEYIGKGIDRAAKFLHGRRIKRWVEDTASFEPGGHLGRFSALASIIAEREVRVVTLKGDVSTRRYRPILNKMAHHALLPKYGFGWSDGETIYLPISVSEMSTGKGQEALARLLLFFLSSQIRWGSLDFDSDEKSMLETDGLLADIYWIVENIRISHLLFNNFPGIMKNWEEIVPYVSKRRPSLSQLNKAEQKVEELLMNKLFEISSAISPAETSGESLKRAESIKEKWIEEGIPIKKYRGMVPFVPWGRLVPGRIKTDGSCHSEEPFSAERGDQGSDQKGESTEGGRYLAGRKKIDEESNEQGLALNIFDKMISWAQFVNVTRPFDDDHDEDISKKADEMEELTVARVSRGTNSILDAELIKEELYADEAADDTQIGKFFLYPEWDYKSKAYRENHSRVRENIIAEEKGDFVDSVLTAKRRLIKDVKRKFEALTPAVRVIGRQPEGDSIDIDAAVEALSDLEAGKQPDDRLYIAHRRMERDITALFLLDFSMSTDAWVKERRVIDHEKEALIVFCEAMQSLQERYAVAGFSGKSRKGCRFYHVKGFDEPYNRKIKKRIEGIIPYHYTRMGPAVRHATSLLKKEKADVKLLFILSDGKPNDIDEYEGRYGIEDTRMSIREAEREGVVPFCLTVDSRAHDYLPRLFGRGNYAVVSGVERLTKSLPDLYARIIRAL